MVRLIVQHHDVLHAHEVGHHPLDHLSFGFQCIQRLAPALEQRAPSLGNLHAFAQLEGVVVGDDDFCPFQIGKHILGNQLAACIVGVRVIGLKHTQTVANGQAGRDNQEAACEFFAGGATYGIDGLPGDEHGHDGCLAGARGQLQGQAHEIRIGVAVGIF